MEQEAAAKRVAMKSADATVIVLRQALQQAERRATDHNYLQVEERLARLRTALRIELGPAALTPSRRAENHSHILQDRHESEVTDDSDICTDDDWNYS